MPPILRCVLVVTLFSVGATARAALDDAELGKDDGYPVQRFGPDFSLLTERYKVGTFSNMERVFWPRDIKTASPAFGLKRAEQAFTVQYPYNGQTYSIEDFLARQRITGLLIMKGDTILFERYQYARKP